MSRPARPRKVRTPVVARVPVRVAPVRGTPARTRVRLWHPYATLRILPEPPDWS